MAARRNQGASLLSPLDPYPKGPSTQLSYTLQNSNLHNYYPKPEYLIIGSFGPLGLGKPKVPGARRHLPNKPAKFAEF